MRKLLWTGALTGAVCLSVVVAAAAEAPEGPQSPAWDLTPYVAHSVANVGYDVATQVYRYHGDFNVTYNALRLKRVGIYGFADVDIESRTDSDLFQPDRLVGTFEGGGRMAIGKSALGVFYRHLSSHNIDRVDRVKPSWEAAGVRYQWAVRPALRMTLSAADYVHHENCRYQSDVDGQAAWLITPHRNHALTLRADVHYVSETGNGRSGYTDYWIEPNYGLSKDVDAYLGYGSVHDIDTSDGRSDHPVMVGFKVKI